MTQRFFAVAMLVLGTAVGCGDSGGGAGSGGSGGSSGTGGTGGRDAGPDARQPDAMPDAGGSCGNVIELTIPAGMNGTSYTGTTAMNALAMLNPQTAGCSIGTMTGPEVVHHLRVPGTGTVRIKASTDDPATMSDTILYVDTQCGAGTELACNDDKTGAGAQFSSEVEFETMGGADLFLVVDTYVNPQGMAQTGPYKLTVGVRAVRQMGQSCDPAGMSDVCVTPLACLGSTPTCQVDPSAPVLSKAESFWVDSTMMDVFLYISGSDTEGNTNRITVQFKDASGANAGTPLSGSFSGLMGQTTFRAFALRGPAPTGAVSVDMYLTDATMKRSSTVNAVIRTEKPLSQACDPMIDSPDECLGELVCTASACAVATATTTACAAAQVLSMPTTNLMGTLTNTSADQFGGSCKYFPGGGEKAYKVTLPALPAGAVKWDLIASTNDTPAFDDMTMVDTYVYVRSTCSDPSSEKACNDDVDAMGGNFRSEATAQDLMPGDYYVFVDSSVPPAASRNYKLAVRSRPVLSAGQACDPMGATNRCANGPCPAAATCP